MGDEKEKIQSHHEPNIDLSHFELSKTVGMGSFGREFDYVDIRKQEKYM